MDTREMEPLRKSCLQRHPFSDHSDYLQARRRQTQGSLALDCGHERVLLYPTSPPKWFVCLVFTLYFMCVGVLPTCVSVCSIRVLCLGGQKRHWIPGTEVTDSYELPCGMLGRKPRSFGRVTNARNC